MNSTGEAVCTGEVAHANEDVTKLGTFTITALAFGVLVSIAKKNFGEYLKLPFTLIVFLIGMLLGAAHAVSNNGLGKLSHSIEQWKSLEPEVLLFIFIPPLLFTSAFEVEYHIFRRLMGQAVILATIAVVICTALLAMVAVWWFGYGWGWNEGFLFGAMFGATDPVAVVALLKELGAPETLSVLIEGESLLNDGVGFVLFLVFFEQLSGRADYNFGEIILKVAESSFFGMLIGVGFGLLGLFCIQQIWDDTIVAVGISVVIVWATFLVSEAFHVSGVIGVVFLGLVFAAYEDGYIKHEVGLSLKRFWKKIEYMANTLLFAFSGIVIVDVLIKAEGAYEMSMRDLLNLLMLFFAINLIRLIAILILYWPLTKLGYGFDWKRCVVVSYAGLRGAVGLIASLVVVNECSCDPDVPSEDQVCLVFATQSRMAFHMAGIVLLTLAVNGTTSKFLVSYLELNKQSVAAKSFFEKATVHVHDHMDVVVESLKRHPHYKNADWDVVWKHLPILSRPVYHERKKMGVPHMRETFTLLRHIDKVSKSRFVGECEKEVSTHVRPASGEEDSEEEGEPGNSTEVDLEASSHPSFPSSKPSLAQQLREARYRFLSLVKASYRRQFYEGANHSWPSLQVLLEIASRCQDYPDRPLDEWDGQLEKYVESTMNCRALCTSRSKALRLAENYNLVATFVRAHKSVVSQFRHFIHESTAEVVETVLEENHVMIESAITYTEFVEHEFPEIASSVKTNIAVQRLLKEMESYAKKLFDRAEIDEKDLETIHEALDQSRRDLKSLRRYKPQDKLQIMRNSSFMLDVEEEIVDMLLALSVHKTFTTGEKVFQEGHDADSVLIIVRGKVSIQLNKGNTNLEKTSGDVLGAIEFVTSGKSYLCDAVCLTTVEVMSISYRILHDVFENCSSIAYNVYREAGLSVLESLYPQFQYATFNLLKSVLPHVRILRGRGGKSRHGGSVQRAGSFSRHNHSVLSMTKPVLFHGGLVIVLKGEVNPVDNVSFTLPLLQPYAPECALLLNNDSVLMHVNADAVSRIEDYDTFDAPIRDHHVVLQSVRRKNKKASHTSVRSISSAESFDSSDPHDL